MAAGREIDGEHDNPPPAPINPPLRWPRRWRITAAAVVILLTAALIFWSPWRTVRVTDGSEVFADHIRQVAQLIEAENDRVTKSDEQWVSIAFMLPIRAFGETETNTREAIRRQIQGAYLAQYWANHPNGQPEFGNDRPLIRLLIADTGHQGENWPDTVEELVKRAKPDSDEHLAAVTGLGPSLSTTQPAVNVLAAQEILMVGASITATNIAADSLFRVPPTNAGEAAAAIRYLENRIEWKSASVAEPYRAYLVHDIAKEDAYVRDLGNAYREAFPEDAAHTLAEYPFDGLEDAAGNALERAVNAICASRHRVVFFAGRADDLEALLRKLSTGSCGAKPLTVVTGDDANNLNAPRSPDGPRLWEKGANFRVLYTAIAFPQVWDEDPPKHMDPRMGQRFKRIFGNQCPQCYEYLFPHDPLDDGDAITGYDAVLTAVTISQKVWFQGNQWPSIGAWRNGLPDEGTPVQGASGKIYFQFKDGRLNRVPHNKAVPIMELHPDGRATLVEVSSPLGTPVTEPR